MCGISGIINKNNKDVPNLEIRKINDLIIHRGPDDEGYYFGKNFAFGHRRLSIIDLSVDGHQPMGYLNKYQIIFNGEIYNYLEIREELLVEGYLFNSKTDTEVLLAAYDKWGEKCVTKFNGMWSFALFDGNKNQIFCSRDRYGIKPFYYTNVNNKFIFGSEIKQLLEYYLVRKVNKKILIDYLIAGLEEHTNETFFENIYKLPQSHNLIYNLNTHTYEIKKYYDISIDKQLQNSLDLNTSIKQYKKVLYNSVMLRLRSDVKLGTCLSGGLDSSSVSAIASEFYSEKTGQKFTAIHAKSTEKKNDESEYAKITAQHCNLNLNIIEPKFEDFYNSIDKVLYTLEEPFGGPSIFMQYFVMKKAKEIGCTVMLDGQGGDETLLGYERYYPAFLKSLSLFGRIYNFFKSSGNSKLSSRQLFFYYIYFINYKIRIFLLNKRSKFIKEKFRKLLSSKRLIEISKNYLNINELQKLEIYSTQLPHLLKYEDKNSMRYSIETRLPLIDYKTLESALSVNNKFKINGGWTKYILREVADNLLPENIVWRKNKFGFEAPEDIWLKKMNNDIIREINNSKLLEELIDKSKLDFNRLGSRIKWKLYNIAKWEQLYSVRID